jgi:hypothetical protein
MSDLKHTPAPGRSRQLINLVIVATLMVAIGTPAAYYVQGDSYDERFAWRMFSGKRAERCAVQVIETRETSGKRTRSALRLTRIIHKAWESGLKRLRPDIMEAFFVRRCKEPDVREVKLIRRCKRADGSPKPDDEIQHICPVRVVIP